ncbi:MAG: hypothetical protein KF910_08410 [Brevundimonas sp.]|uniref:hypothetical protein n=1 Tax=Brevundimonas sp. TaxID=1871086 RepID=UPI0025B80697|nr:hypothetical protein [Brevundimonas sp.]MBX3477616.1 hypothetical protein [Brevundimonas sp.]
MFAVLILSLSLSLGLQAAPEAVEAERCLQTLRALDGRVNRSARVDRRYMDEVQMIAAINGHTYRHGGWPLPFARPGDGASVTPEQADEIRREAEQAGVAVLSERLEQCLVRFPITRADD